MNKLMTAPGTLRSSGGEVMTRSTMGLTAHALDDPNQEAAVRIVMADTLPGGSEMEVTFDLEQAVAFANVLREVAHSAGARQEGIQEKQLVPAS